MKRSFDFVRELLAEIESHQIANDLLYQYFGIRSFFLDDAELNQIKIFINKPDESIERTDRAEYGDFQTNAHLALHVTNLIAEKGISPNVVIEPTCGVGNFMVASLATFKGIKVLFGIDIYKPYTWECKFNIIDYYLDNSPTDKPDIYIMHANVFEYDFNSIRKKYHHDNILIVGNPPWVTNSMLGSLNSSNIPRKSNFKNQNGIDAITGKGNFDIAEYITVSLIKIFQDCNANLAVLLKNTVIKNIIYEQQWANYSISSIEKYRIDSKKEFRVAVEASLLYAQLNSKSQYSCKDMDLYDYHTVPHKQFGWVNQKFVSDIRSYADSSTVDGECPFMWRQGLKHDCSAVMELDRDSEKNNYRNALNETFSIEDGLVYGLLKSSDIKDSVIEKPRKYTIVTQRIIKQDTFYIKREYPMTYKYLYEHLRFFQKRKSSIYNNKPMFSIFGIGDYSFATYKIGVSGLYKQPHFALILPDKGKPVMLDDTCYFIGFERIDYAVFALILLNSDKNRTFLQSITFPDAKRTLTKDLLMRIDLYQIAVSYSLAYIKSELIALNASVFGVTIDTWDDFLNELHPKVNQQMSLQFA